MILYSPSSLSPITMTSESQFEAASKWLSSSSKAGGMSNDTKLEACPNVVRTDQ